MARQTWDKCLFLSLLQYPENIIQYYQGEGTISLIIPFLAIDKDKHDVLSRCLHSLSGEYDELLIEDTKWKTLAQNINAGLRKSNGDFIVVSNDDILLRSGHLKDLCVKGEVHSPVVHGGINKTFHAHLYCMPREVYEKIGLYDETCPGAYYIDSDYWVRLVKAEIPVVMNEKVHIDHPEPARTLKHTDEKMSETRKWFIKKHGKRWLSLVE